MQINVDPTLTPESAPKRGYEYVGETIYDPEAPPEAMKDIDEKIAQGWKLGTSIHELGKDIFVGMYAPLKNN